MNKLAAAEIPSMQTACHVGACERDSHSNSKFSHPHEKSGTCRHSTDASASAKQRNNSDATAPAPDNR